jgi:hypothetical protein
VQRLIAVGGQNVENYGVAVIYRISSCLYFSMAGKTNSGKTILNPIGGLPH